MYIQTQKRYETNICSIQQSGQTRKINRLGFYGTFSTNRLLHAFTKNVRDLKNCISEKKVENVTCWEYAYNETVTTNNSSGLVLMKTDDNVEATNRSIDPLLIALHTMTRVDHNKLAGVVNAAFVSSNFTFGTQHPELKQVNSTEHFFQANEWRQKMQFHTRLLAPAN